MFISGLEATTPGQLAERLAMDRTTVTALLRALHRRGLAATQPQIGYRRLRRVAIAPPGRALLTEALPIWRSHHARPEAELTTDAAARGRPPLRAFSEAPLATDA